MTTRRGARRRVIGGSVFSRGSASSGSPSLSAIGPARELGRRSRDDPFHVPRGERMKRARLLAAVRDRMRSRPMTREPEDGSHATRSPRTTQTRRTAKPDRDDELEQLMAEARYHRDRFDLYRARVVSGSSAATSLTRLRELERTATAAAERLAHAQRTRRRAAESPRDAYADG